MAKGALIIVHGGGDHSGRYENVINRLAPENYAVHAFDWRGHGKSPGIRGHINKWEDLREDLGLFIETVHQQHPDLPLFLFGHSMGGVIVLDYCLRSPKHISGIVCSSPAIGKIGISPILMQAAKILNRIWPSLSTPTGLDISKLTHDPEFIEFTKNDPLYHRRATPRFGLEHSKTVKFIQAHAANLKLPALLIHGNADEIISIDGSRRFMENCRNPQLNYIEYQGGYHELFNDTIKARVLDDIIFWLNSRYPAS